MKDPKEKVIKELAEDAKRLRLKLTSVNESTIKGGANPRIHDELIGEGGKTLIELERVLRLLSPQRFGVVGITLGRTDGIAKFFAFSFVASEKRSLTSLGGNPFWGSGVYAIYYCGKTEPAYAPLSGTETPIYVGKADPTDAFADSIEAQGQTLFRRL